MKRYAIAGALVLCVAPALAQAPIPGQGGGGGSADPNAVTAAGTLTSNLPMIGGGSKAAAVGTRSGNTTAYVTTTGTQTSGDCVKIDANGNHVANGSACASGSLGGDLSGTTAAATVAKVDGVTVDMHSTAPVNGQSICHDGSKYVPCTINTNNIAPGKTKVSSSSVLTINDGCSSGDPCNILIGNTTYAFTTSATATINSGSGSGTAKVFVSVGGAITVQHPTAAGLSVSCTNCTQSQVTTPSIPSGAVPLYSVTITSGTWAAVSDLRSFVGGSPTIASGSLALDTDAIAANGACDTMTTTATGAVSTDTVSYTPNADITAVTGYAPTAGVLMIYPWITADTLHFKVCNPTADSITPGAVTLNWRIAR